MKAIYKIPPGVHIRTPSGRLARVMRYDDENRVHVKYVGAEALEGEQGCFPASMLSKFSVAPEMAAERPHINTHVDPDPKTTAAPEYHFYRERMGYLPK